MFIHTSLNQSCPAKKADKFTLALEDKAGRGRTGWVPQQASGRRKTWGRLRAHGSTSPNGTSPPLRLVYERNATAEGGRGNGCFSIR